MSLETLHIAQATAADLLSMQAEELEPMRRQEVHHLGAIVLNGVPMDAFRVLTGPEGRIGKGGIRFSTYDSYETALADASELSGEMQVKLAARGHSDVFRGGKGVVNIRGKKLSPEDKKHIAREFQALMENAGLVGHDIDVPAGDLGTNGLSDIYAAEHLKRHPEDKYGLAVITGKSPENGGLEARAGATGLGVLAAQHALMAARGVSKATVALQGFGNVASWYAYFANNDPQGRISVQAISEVEGVLWTTDPRGLPITEKMVRAIGDNKDWTGPKLHELARMIKAKHPDLELRFNTKSTDIITHPADYFVPAAMGNVITGENVAKLGAKRGVMEAGNGTTTAEAHQYLVQSGRDVVADVGANGAGVDGSIKERQANIDMADGTISVPPDRETVEKELYDSSARLMQDTLRAAETLGTSDLRAAVAALAIDRASGRNEL